MMDTTETVAQRQLEIYRRLDGAAKLRLVFEMSAMARSFARSEAAIRSDAGAPDRNFLAFQSYDLGVHRKYKNALTQS